MRVAIEYTCVKTFGLGVSVLTMQLHHTSVNVAKDKELINNCLYSNVWNLFEETGREQD